MVQDVTERTFPPSEPRVLEPELFKPLLRQALLTYLTVLSQSEPRLYSRTILRATENAITGEEVSFPWYRDWNPDIVHKAMASTELRSFFDYIWDRGEMHRTLTGPNPTRESWESCVISDVIHYPLVRILDESALDEVIDTGHITYWKLPDAALDQLSDELVLRFCRGKHRYIVKCSLGFVDGELGAVWQLADGISLHRYSHRDIGRYLSRHHQKFSSYDLFSGLALSNIATLEITQTYEPPQSRSDKTKIDMVTLSRIIKEQTADLIDVIKWSLLIAFEQSNPLIEGVITFEDVLGGPLSFVGLNPFRRQDTNSGPAYSLNEAGVTRAGNLIRGALKGNQKCRDLKQAFWYWGRSALAELDRDILLDAVIGLEGLLVPNPGESRYRFGLHGVALLANPVEKAEATAKELREIYTQRSKAAHANPATRQEGAYIARKYLGHAILSVMKLIDAAVFRPSLRISEQLEREILKRVPISL